MRALRYAGLLALVVWLGGLVVLAAVAAPAIFDVIAARRIPDGRVLAGAIFGTALWRFHLVAYGAAILLLLTMIVRALLGPRPRRFAVRTCIILAMLAVSVYSGIFVMGRITRLQAAIGRAPSDLSVDDPRRIEFGRLHATSTGLQLIPLIGGLALLYWELGD
jgi:hypothetical protein